MPHNRKINRLLKRTHTQIYIRIRAAFFLLFQIGNVYVFLSDLLRSLFLVLALVLFYSLRIKLTFEQFFPLSFRSVRLFALRISLFCMCFFFCFRFSSHFSSFLCSFQCFHCVQFVFIWSSHRSMYLYIGFVYLVRIVRFFVSFLFMNFFLFSNRGFFASAFLLLLFLLCRQFYFLIASLFVPFNIFSAASAIPL